MRAMRTAPFLTCAVSSALVAGLTAAIRAGAMPLGVRGEWEWLRLPVAPAAVNVGLAAASVLAYALFVGLAGLALRRASRLRECVALPSLFAASVLVQAAAHLGAPDGYGLAKWVVALNAKGASGYFSVATAEARDPWRFAAGYPEWVSRQDALHLGTHPPGLILLQSALLGALERSPASARLVEDRVPDTVAVAFRVFRSDRLGTPAARATLALTGFLTLLACAATVIPLYLLARVGLPATGAWSAAALWPLVPSAILFQPTADTAFPLLATTALALAAHAGRSGPVRGSFLAALAGVVLGLGMQFSLVFLPVGLVVAVVTLGDGHRPVGAGVRRILATGAGFLGFTGCVWLLTTANPFVIWWWNQRNHARFYTEFPRSYGAWVVANPVELAVGLGLPATAWAVLAVGWPREIPRVSVATVAVLTVLTLGGWNLSEIGRLWLPFMPALLVAAAFSMGKLGGGPGTLAATVALVGVQTLALEALIQVVYPV